MTADATPAWTAWSALDGETRRQLAELATRGRRHPDERSLLLRRGRRWVVSSGDDRRTPDWLDRVLGLFQVVITGPDPLGAAQQRAQDQADRHWAFRVLRAR